MYISLCGCMSSWGLSTLKFIHIRGVTFLLGILLVWSPPFLSFILWWLQKEFAPWVLVLFFLYLLHSFVIEVFFVSHACLGEHVDSNVRLSLMLHSSFGIFAWCPTIFLFQVPWFTSILWYQFEKMFGEWWFHICALCIQIQKF